VWNLWHATHGSGDPGRRAGDDGYAMECSGEWSWSMISGGIRRWRSTRSNGSDDVSNGGNTEDGGAPVHGGQQTRAAASRGTATTMCRMAAALCGTLAGGAWQPINRLGRFGRTGARMGVWVVGLNCDGGGRGAQLASLEGYV
jgi:hypothetical protein